MFLIDDDCFTKMLGGEFYQVIVAKKQHPDISIYKLFHLYQFKYDSYIGFRNFYRKHLEPIINGIRLIDDNSIKGKAIRFITNEKNK